MAGTLSVQLSERDLDMLLLEEFHTCNTFRSHFLNAALAQSISSHTLISIRHSVSETVDGETDLELVVELDNQLRVAILVENKIRAEPQKNQGKRYRIRGQQGIDQGRWSQYRSVMVAPSRYLHGCSDADNYDVGVAYETISDWLLAGGDSPRIVHKALLLTLAVEDCRKGYTRQKNDKVTDFFSRYGRLVESEFPMLEVTNPNPGHRSDAIGFLAPGLAARRRLKHSLKSGFAVLAFVGQGVRTEILRSTWTTALPPEAYFHRGKSEAQVVIRVPKLKVLEPFEDQLVHARTALAAVRQLLECSKSIDHTWTQLDPA